MDRYLLNSELPVILTRPGLLNQAGEVGQARPPVPMVGDPQEAAGYRDVTFGDTVPGADTISVPPPEGGAWDAETATLDPQFNDGLEIQKVDDDGNLVLSTAAVTGTGPKRVWIHGGGDDRSLTKVHFQAVESDQVDPNAAAQAATEGGGGAEPAAPSAGAGDQPTPAAEDPNSGRTDLERTGPEVARNRRLEQNMVQWDRTAQQTAENLYGAMWPGGEVTADKLETAHNALQEQLKPAQDAVEAAEAELEAAEEALASATDETRADAKKKVDEAKEKLNGNNGAKAQLNEIERRLELSDEFKDLMGDYFDAVDSYETDKVNNYQDLARVLNDGNHRRIAEIGGLTVLQALNPNANVGADKIREVRGILNDQSSPGTMGAQSSGNALQSFNRGVGNAAATIDNVTGLVDAAGNLVSRFYTPSPVGANPYGAGYGGYGAGYGAFGASPFGGTPGVNPFGGGFGGLGFNLANMNVATNITLGTSSRREEDRKIMMILQQLLQAIMAGNIDAISTALTFISRQGKQTLLDAAGRTVRAMMSFERQQRLINDKIGDLSQDSPNYASSLQNLTNEMNMYSANRQAIVNFLRDVKSMSDELENISKSWQDVHLQQGRRQMMWSA